MDDDPIAKLNIVDQPVGNLVGWMIRHRRSGP